jgi:hypothetical protein
VTVVLIRRLFPKHGTGQGEYHDCGVYVTCVHSKANLKISFSPEDTSQVAAVCPVVSDAGANRTRFFGLLLPPRTHSPPGIAPLTHSSFSWF